MMRQLLAFGLTGVAAALTHLTVVALLVEAAGLPPLLANVGGFFTAFGVSYTGHRRFTFAATRLPLGRTLLRFFVVAGLGFLLNETLFALLLARTALPYPLALALVILTVAVLTFVLGRHWAFSGGGRLLKRQTRSNLPQR